jgi:tetratricopeptide (TPR) repeat protein
MKRILAICLIPFIAWAAETSEAPREWSDSVSEGKALINAGNYSAGAQAFRRALAVAKRAKADERKLLEIHDALASAYANAGYYAESEHEYRRALALAEKTEVAQSLAYALLLASRAVLPTQIGNRDAVSETLRAAIAVNRRTGSARELVIVRACLAQILMDGRRYVEAESVLVDAQSGAASLSTTDPGLLADVSNGLGVLRFDQGRYTESIGLYLASLGLFEGAMGDEHPALVAPLNNLALSYLKLGRFNDAELTLRRANAVCSRTLGEDHPTCGAILEGYAVVLRKLNRKREAKSVGARSQQIARSFRSRNGVGSTISVSALRSRPNKVR